MKETTEITKLEVIYIKIQMTSLTPLTLSLGGTEVNVTYELPLTMVDGKICNAITSASSLVCYF